MLLQFRYKISLAQPSRACLCRVPQHPAAKTHGVSGLILAVFQKIIYFLPPPDFFQIVLDFFRLVCYNFIVIFDRLRLPYVWRIET